MLRKPRFNLPRVPQHFIRVALKLSGVRSQFFLILEEVVAWPSQGFGQMYLGETRNGLIRLGIAAAALMAAAVPVYAAAHGGHNSPLDVAAGVGGLIVLSFDFTSSYDNAIHGVVRWNERAESEFNLANPSAP